MPPAPLGWYLINFYQIIFFLIKANILIVKHCQANSSFNLKCEKRGLALKCFYLLILNFFAFPNNVKGGNPKNATIT